MAGLFVYRSNHLEALGQRLAGVCREPLPSPLQPEIIVVQSLGMRRWVSFELATRLGVTMNCQFPFFQEFASLLLGSNPGEHAFARAILPWRILALLPGLLSRAGFEALQRYRGEDAASARRRFQLSHQIASVFDRYLAYAPERLLAWNSRSESGWQAQLWRELTREYPDSHPPALLQKFIGSAVAGQPLPRGVSPRVSIFGISAVPPFHLHLISAAAKILDVHLFLLEPTDQYWGDVLSRKEQDRVLRQPANKAKTAAELHLEAGNELLASFGKPGRIFAREVQDLEPDGSEELFTVPTGTSLLAAVQREIFEVREAVTDEIPVPAPIAAGDKSLQIHCCHSPIRELQVLHDHLLQLFEQLPGLMPKDILVTMPDVEVFAPLIEAVFDSPESDEKRLPFSIADRSARAESQVARALLMILDLRGSRFGASTVLELLELKPVRDRFEIAESELDLLRDWTQQAGIRWGIDGPHRATFDLPPFEQNSWRAGLDRLLLGYALPGDGATLFGEILPFPEIEGNLAELLGRFIDFCEKLFSAAADLERARTLGQWELSLRSLLDTFVADRDELANELKRVRGAIRQVGSLAEWHPAEVPYDIVRAHLKSVFSESQSGFGFLAGHITFCSLKPMRSIPFRVICVLGLNDDAFPRHEPQLSFDVLANDRAGVASSRRDDDRQLFLETILSARDTLYLSYSGLSVRDNAEAPPSVVVSELLDYLARNHRGADGKAAAAIKHPLQPFSPRYFTPGSPLFSYSAEQAAASRAVSAPRLGAASAVSDLLPELSTDDRVLELRDLTTFFGHPAKYFLHDRLRARLCKPDEAGSECEPLKIEGLDRWKVQASLVSAGVDGSGPDALRVSRAKGVLPSGFFGAAAFATMDADARALLAAASSARAGGPLPPQALRAVDAGWEIEGIITDLFADGIVEVIGWKMRARDRIRTWVRHLFVNTAGGEPKCTRLFCTDRKVEFPPLENASELLSHLLTVFAAGQRAPLPFFPETSFAYAKAHLDGKAPTPGFPPVRNAWKNERDDIHIELCFRNVPEPLDEHWSAMALEIFSPMLAVMKEERLK